MHLVLYSAESLAMQTPLLMLIAADNSSMAKSYYRPCVCPVVHRYFYISIVYNVSYTFALYGLLLFWIGASELLQPFNPLLKFILVKAVVFLTFWQVSCPSFVGHAAVNAHMKSAVLCSTLAPLTCCYGSVNHASYLKRPMPLTGHSWDSRHLPPHASHSM